MGGCNSIPDRADIGCLIHVYTVFLRVFEFHSYMRLFSLRKLFVKFNELNRNLNLGDFHNLEHSLMASGL